MLTLSYVKWLVQAPCSVVHCFCKSAECPEVPGSLPNAGKGVQGSQNPGPHGAQLLQGGFGGYVWKNWPAEVVVGVYGTSFLVVLFAQ